MTDYTVVIPYADQGDEWRDRARHYVVDYLAARYPWPIIVEPGENGVPWSKGAIVDRAVQRVDTPGVIIHDADVIVPTHELASAATAVTVGHPWAQPHGEVYRLNSRMTMRLYTGQLHGDPHPFLGSGSLERRMHAAPHGGGIVVVSRKAYDAVGGIDPRFVGWGGEDISFARALDTLVGPAYRNVRGIMWHLHHTSQEMRPGRRASVESEALASRYLDAVGNPDAMREVVTR